MRTHPFVGDSLIAILLLLVDSAIYLVNVIDPEKNAVAWFLAVPLNVATVLPVVFRRKHPIIAAYSALLVSIPHAILELGMSSTVSNAIALYTMVVYVGRKPALYFLLAQLVVLGSQVTFLPATQLWFALWFILSGLAFCWVLGEFVGARRAYHAELEARLHLLETERGQATQIAVAEERARIARELHDVVTHAVSVMVVQADGASYAINGNPESARRAVCTISETGRGALRELRQLLNVLRDEGGESEPRSPQPNAGALAELTERIQAAGVRVQLSLTGELAELPTGLSLGVYRIVQESLTNALKHAGQGAQVTVRIRQDGESVEMEIVDDGAGRASAPVFLSAHKASSEQAGPNGSTTGNGLIGMRERANVLGGQLVAGPAPGGGWRVRATLPIHVSGQRSS